MIDLNNLTYLQRSLVEKIVLTPTNGELSMTFHGTLAGILTLATKGGENMGTEIIMNKLEALAANDNQRPAS